MIAQELWDRMDGIEMQHAWQRGKLPRTPLSNLLGTDLQEAAEGTVTLTMPASRWFSNTGGTLYGGILRSSPTPRSTALVRYADDADVLGQLVQRQVAQSAVLERAVRS
jgi:hypothetical protein